MFIDFKGAFSSINERKEEKHAFASLIKNFELIIDVTKEVQGLLHLTTVVVFRNLFSVKNHIS